VFDPTNFLENALTAIRTLQSNINEATQIANQVRQIANQVQQLQNDATNLLSLPFSLLNELQNSIAQYTSLLQQASGLTYQLNGFVSQFTQLYPTFGQPALSSATLLQQTQRWTAQMRAAAQGAMQAQSIVDRLTGQRDRLTRALAASEGATGNLQGTQATNQLLGLMAEQQASLQDILAASSRAEASLIATEAAQADAAHFMDGFTTMAPVQGVGIPPFK